MLVSEVVGLIQGELLTTETENKEVQCGYTCDLLSWVMAKGQPGCAWVTVQTHINVVAVASLHDMACIISPESIRMEDASIQKAQEEGIAVITSPLNAFDICGILKQAGIAGV